MRSLLTLVVALTAFALLSGMGGLGGQPEGTLPETDEEVAAQLVDRSGVTTALTRFSMDGKIFLEGRLGDGKLDVFFRDLREVTFGKVGGDEVPAELLLKSGSRLKVQVRKRAVFYGDTGHGTYRIPARDVARIAFPE